MVSHSGSRPTQRHWAGLACGSYGGESGECGVWLNGLSLSIVCACFAHDGDKYIFQIGAANFHVLHMHARLA